MNKHSQPAAEGYQYVGGELDLFAEAVNWKSYYARRLRPYITGSVLEVGAGIGGTSRFLCTPGVTRWTCLEPDPRLAAQLRRSLTADPLPAATDFLTGVTADLPPGSTYDTVLYIDVLEHIERDADELARGFGLLRPGGRVIVLSPAHQWLFTPFDAAIGHYRRYTRASVASLQPWGEAAERVFYLDGVGMLASLGNKLLLRQRHPTRAQIRAWDRWMIPVSRLLDPCLGGWVGKTVVGVWRRPPLSQVAE